MKSNEELFKIIDSMINELKKDNKIQVADELETGLSCLNGLTDGWYLLFESIEKTMDNYSNSISQEQKMKLCAISKTIKRIIKRK